MAGIGYNDRRPSLHDGRRLPIMRGMSVPRFFVDSLSAGCVLLPEREARHALMSRRLKAGQEVTLFDGAGTDAPGRIVSADRNGVRIEVAAVAPRARPRPELTLATALPKGARQDVLIEKCTELGVAAIQPLLTERSVASATTHRLQKWRQTAIEAAKQSNQCWLPELRAPRPLAAVLADLSLFDLMLLAASCETPDTTLTREIDLQAANRIIGFVGPEGGWAKQEFEAILGAGARPVTLGPNVLRIETAAIALCAAVHGEMRRTA